jgi:molybdate transport system ATP-binding protein
MSASHDTQRTALSATLRLRRGAGFVLDIALHVSKGVTVLLGPSGSGKSTALDLLAGHQQADSGRIELDGQLLFLRREGAPAEVSLPAAQRRIGYVMQSPALFPHLSVKQNLEYGLFHWPKPEAKARVAELAEALALGPLLSRWPQGLSGGERQRVALARALAPRPRALLLDEPLSAVDLPQRAALLKTLQSMLGALEIPVLYVTHSIEEQRFFTEAGHGRTLRLSARPDGATVEVSEEPAA